MSITEKEELLLKVNYDANDIMKLANCKRTWATKIMNTCKRKYNGTVIGRNVIKASSYWLYEGTTLDEELRLLAIVKGNYGKTLQERNI